LAAYADLTNAETTASAVAFADFKLPPPQPPAPEYRDQMVETAISRIWQSGADLAAGISSAPVESTNPGVTSAVKPRELWMLLVSRLATRGKSPRDGVEGMERLQQMTCDYIAADFVKRWVACRS
jgi:symplekin